MFETVRFLYYAIVRAYFDYRGRSLLDYCEWLHSHAHGR